MVERSPWLLFVVAGLASYSAGVVWLAQSSCYPLWRYVGARDFPGYYAAWSRSNWGIIVAPLALVLAGAVMMLLRRPPGVPGWALWLVFILQVGVVALTLAWWSPPAARMLAPSGGMNSEVYAALIGTHWLRVAMVTVNAALLVWMFAEALLARLPGGLGRSRLLLLGTVALALYSAGNIWPVQLVCYRLWTHVGPGEFYPYHVAWWHSIWGVIFVPAGLVFLGTAAMLWLRPEGVDGRLLWTAFALQIGLYALTAVWWGPLMARLGTPEKGLSLPSYRLLMSTHWLRVAIVSAYGIVAVWILVKAVAARLAVPPGMGPAGRL